MTRVQATVNVIGKATLTCDVPPYWEELCEQEKIEYFLVHCCMVMEMHELKVLDDEGLSAQEIEEV
jgi:hypothetical protein